MKQDNAKQVKVSAETYANRLGRSESFKRGYNDYIKGHPYDYDIENKYEAVSYARGRSFAIFSQQQRAPRAVWRKGVLAKTAKQRLVLAARTGYVL